MIYYILKLEMNKFQIINFFIPELTNQLKTDNFYRNSSLEKRRKKLCDAAA